MEKRKIKGIEFLEKFKIPEKQKRVLMIAALVLGLGIILAGYNIGGSSQQERVLQVEDKTTTPTTTVHTSSMLTQAEIALENRLERILSQIDGAGRVAVSVTFKASPEFEYAVDVSTTERSITETDQSGGSRVTLDTTETGQLVLTRISSSAGEQPVVIREIKPEVQGVLVVAEGASNPLVKVELTRAVQTLLGLSANQVNVVSGKGW